MKVYKITLCFTDFDGIGEDEAISLIENARLPNHIDLGFVAEIKSIDIGEWDDTNPLNNKKTRQAEFKRLFE